MLKRNDIRNTIKSTACLALAAITIAHAADAPAPSKQLPLPPSPKQAEVRDTSGSDPTLAATRATLHGTLGAARSGPAPFQKFTIPDPLEGQQPIPTRTPIADAEAPVMASSGKPALPLLK